MKLRGLLIAATVLAALLGALYWSNRHSSNADSSTKTAADAPTKILSLSATDINSLAMQRKNEAPVDLSRNSSGAWQITAPKALAADQDSVSTVLSALSSLNAERLLEDKATDLAAYGLAAPAAEITITSKNTKTQKLLIGDQTPSGSAFYAMLAGDPRLFTLASYNKSSIDKTADDLRDKRLLTADFDKVSQIELITSKEKKQDITFARNKDAWQILKPAPYRAETYKVEDLVRSLKEAKMETAADEAKDAAAFQSASPFAIAKISGASGTQELEIRNVKDDYYAKSTALSGVYKMAATTATSMDKPLDDFRNKKLFDFGYEDPNKIEIHTAPNPTSLLIPLPIGGVRTGRSWTIPRCRRFLATSATWLRRNSPIPGSTRLRSKLRYPRMTVSGWSAFRSRKWLPTISPSGRASRRCTSFLPRRFHSWKKRPRRSSLLRPRRPPSQSRFCSIAPTALSGFLRRESFNSLATALSRCFCFAAGLASASIAFDSTPRHSNRWFAPSYMSTTSSPVCTVVLDAPAVAELTPAADP